MEGSAAEKTGSLHTIDAMSRKDHYADRKSKRGHGRVILMEAAEGKQSPFFLSSHNKVLISVTEITDTGSVWFG